MEDYTILIQLGFAAPVLIALASRRMPYILACVLLMALAVWAIVQLGLGGVVLALILWIVALILSLAGISSKGRIARETAMVAELRKANELAQQAIDRQAT